MKYYTFSFLALGIILGVGIFVDLVFLRAAYVGTVSDVKKVESSLSSEATLLELSISKYNNSFEKSLVDQQYLVKWAPRLKATQSTQEIITGFSDLVSKVSGGSDHGKGLAFELKNFTEKTDYPFAGRTQKVYWGQVELRGPYYLVMNWLGALEARYPSVKVDHVVLKVQATAVFATITMHFPLFNSDFDVKPLPKEG